MATKPGWCMLGVRKTTRERLKVFREKLRLAYEEGRLELPDHQADHTSIDFVLNRLLEEALDKRKRSRESKRNGGGQRGGGVINQSVNLPAEG